MLLASRKSAILFRECTNDYDRPTLDEKVKIELSDIKHQSEQNEPEICVVSTSTNLVPWLILKACLVNLS